MTVKKDMPTCSCTNPIIAEIVPGQGGRPPHLLIDGHPIGYALVDEFPLDIKVGEETPIATYRRKKVFLKRTERGMAITCNGKVMLQQWEYDQKSSDSSLGSNRLTPFVPPERCWWCESEELVRVKDSPKRWECRRCGQVNRAKKSKRQQIVVRQPNGDLLVQPAQSGLVFTVKRDQFQDLPLNIRNKLAYSLSR